MSRHPFKGEVRLRSMKPRNRYIEDWEIVEALSLVPKRKSGSVLMLQAYIRVKMLIGIRRGDMLRLRMSDIADAGITVRPHKTANSTGWDSMWQRFMSRLLGETKITQRFTEHDLRGKVGSDADSLERARQLLGHADSKITERVYRRKPELVRPLR
jgi:integrase